MHIVGIVAEYNPFHTGHKYHIEKAREETAADGIVAVMSSSFVQRGEPAVFDKWTRALHALENGVDVVLELPTVYALSSAEGFARGAVQTLKATGVVDTISFGSECGDAEKLRRAADILEAEPPVFKEVLRKSLREGKSYAAARAHALAAVDSEAATLLSSPNNILALSYLRTAGKEMHVHTVKRQGADYLETKPCGTFASALALRRMLSEGKSIEAFVPYKTEGLSIHALEQYENLILYALRTSEWKEYASIPETVKKRLADCKMNSLEMAMESAKRKSIPMAAIKRALTHVLLQNSLSSSVLPAYIRVLGFTSRGAAILKEMKKTARLPVITRPAAFKENCPIWELEKRATDIYFLNDHLPNQDVKRAPVRVQGR